MSSIEDDIRRSQRIYEDLLKQQHLIPRDVLGEMAKGISDHLARERSNVFGPLSLAFSVQERSRLLNSQIIGGLGKSYSNALVQAAENARRSILGRDIAAEAVRWHDVRESVLGSAMLPRLDHLLDSSSLKWQWQLGTITSALDRAVTGWPGLTASAGFVETLAAPAFAYSMFSRRTVKRLRRASDEDTPALEGSLVLAGQQVTATTAVVAAFLDAAAVEDEVSADSLPRDAMTGAGDREANSTRDDVRPEIDERLLDENASSITLFRAQQTELVAASVGIDSGFEALLDVSPSARAAALAVQLVGTVLIVEEARQMAGADPIFTRTLELMRSVAVLPVHRVSSRDSLANAVDALYVLVYEASGTMNRVTSVLDSKLCEPVWQLKSLRNKWLRHDPEHGDVKKSLAQLRAGLAYFGMNRKPHTSAEFAALYEAVLERMNEFANELLAAVLASERGNA